MQSKDASRVNSVDFSELHFDEAGLIPVVAQDAATGEVLMVAWANKEALLLTIERGELVLWSRSRKELWHKGATSGNRMNVLELCVDCDGDTLLALVEPMGPACHTGERSCFFRSLWGNAAREGTFLGRLWRYLEKRSMDSPEESYTAKLIARGRKRVGQKVGEEGVETALAVATDDRDNFRYEAADLLYHLLVACISMKVPLTELLKELESRHQAKK